ncbi:MAG: hypothetical protein JNK04_04515 [Myxococcales bacterium]|nr:hypothetical protein [Myxococcales bacterium]
MRALYASNSRTCGIDGDGSVWCFGEDACGATEDPRRPSIVPGLERVEQLSLRDDVLCVVTQDGANARRATCIPCGRSGGDKPSATLAPDLAGARAVSADADRGCALFDGGRVACWGELQRGSRYESGPRRVDKPVLQAVGDLTGMVEIDATPTSVCARAEDGGVHCWGRNAEGELGAGSMPWLAEAASASVLAKGPFVDVAAANHTTCGLTAAGRVECFGAPLDADAAKVAGGIAAATALDSTGVQICATVGSAPPICFPQVPAPTDAIAKLEGVRAVARGDEHACAVMHNGTVRCAGDNKLGQLGRPGPASTRPLEVPGLRDVRTIASTESQTCALTASGALYCWGVDDRVRERVGKSSRRPAQVLADVTEIAAGERHFCALGARKELWCWGTDTHGQLGDSAELAYRFEPVVVKTPGEVAHIALGREHSCALLASGDVRCWGNNANGSLGDTVPRKFYDRPFRVPGLPTVSASSRAPR